MSDITVRASTAQGLKPIKRRQVTTWAPPDDESAEPILIYCSERGRFYCFVGSEEVSSLTLNDLRCYLRDNRAELDTELLVFEPRILMSTYKGELRIARLLYARHKKSGRLYVIEKGYGSNHGTKEEDRIWNARCDGPDWIMAFAEGIKKGWTRCTKVEDQRRFDSMIEYTPERWKAAWGVKKQYREAIKALDNILLTKGGQCLDAVTQDLESPLLLSSPKEES